MEVHDDDVICCFGLVIGLWVEGSRHVYLGAHQSHELAPESQSEDLVIVDTMD